MKQTTLIFIFAVWCSMAWGQNPSLTPTVIASSGDYVKQGQLEISYTVGEMTAVATVGSINAVLLTQGFHQPQEFGEVGITEIAPAAINFVVYPNPTTTGIQTSFEMPEAGFATIAITDINGNRLQSLQKNYLGGKVSQQIAVNSLASGSYLLTIAFTGNNGQKYFSSKPFLVIQ